MGCWFILIAYNNKSVNYIMDRTVISANFKFDFRRIFVTIYVTPSWHHTAVLMS